MHTSTFARGLVRALLAVVAAGAGTARAVTWYVPDHFPTIQAAIDASANGDVILVRPGTYAEALTIADKAITLQSTGGAKVTILDGQNLFRPLTIYGQSAYSVVDGFTITNGWAGAGGGIYTYWADPTFRNLVVTRNRAYYGGGLYIGYGSCYVWIDDSEVSDNVADYYGGGQNSVVSCTRYNRSRIVRNVAGGNGGALASLGFCTTAYAVDSVIADNVAGGAGGALFVSGSSSCGASVGAVNSLVVRNQAASAGGLSVNVNGYGFLDSVTMADNPGGTVVSQPGVYNVISNTILWGSGVPPVLATTTSYGTQNTVQGTDMEGGVQLGFAGDGTNISADPLFVDPAGGDYHLRPGSPCIDKGVASGPATDLDGNPRPNGLGFDMGAYEYSLLRIEAQVVLDPKTLNRCNVNGWITGYVTLPPGFDPGAVLVPSVFIDDAISAVRSEVQDGVLMVKFDRESLTRYLDGPDRIVTLTVTGEIPGVARFTGQAPIRAIAPCK